MPSVFLLVRLSSLDGRIRIAAAPLALVRNSLRARGPARGCLLRLRFCVLRETALQGVHQIDDFGAVRRSHEALSPVPSPSPRPARAARPDSGLGSSPARTRPIGGASTSTLVVRLACLRPEQDAWTHTAGIPACRVVDAPPPQARATLPIRFFSFHGPPNGCTGTTSTLTGPPCVPAAVVAWAV